MENDVTIGEIWRAVQRIEHSIESLQSTIRESSMDIDALKQSRTTATWLLGGLWALVLTLIPAIVRRWWEGR